MVRTETEQFGWRQQIDIADRGDFGVSRLDIIVPSLWHLGMRIEILAIFYIYPFSVVKK